MKYFLSFLAIVVGFLLVKYTEWLIQNFGLVDWAEHYLGTYGGTRLMWKLTGILFIIGALLVISGLMNVILISIFSPVTRGLDNMQY